MERSSERRVRLPKDHSPERRASARFPLTLEVRYSVSHQGVPVETGSCRIIDMSSSGLRFTADRPLLAGLRLDVSMISLSKVDYTSLQLTTAQAAIFERQAVNRANPIDQVASAELPAVLTSIADEIKQVFAKAKSRPVEA